MVGTQYRCKSVTIPIVELSIYIHIASDAFFISSFIFASPILLADDINSRLRIAQRTSLTRTEKEQNKMHRTRKHPKFGNNSRFNNNYSGNIHFCFDSRKIWIQSVFSTNLKFYGNVYIPNANRFLKPDAILKFKTKWH